MAIFGADDTFAVFLFINFTLCLIAGNMTSLGYQRRWEKRGREQREQSGGAWGRLGGGGSEGRETNDSIAPSVSPGRASPSEDRVHSLPVPPLLFKVGPSVPGAP